MSTITQTSQQSDESPQQHSFSLQIMNSIFHIQLTQFSRSTLIYICDSSHPSVDSVSASVLFDKQPVSRKLLGTEDPLVQDIASFLTKKFSRPIILSWGVSQFDDMLSIALKQGLIEVLTPFLQPTTPTTTPPQKEQKAD